MCRGPRIGIASSSGRPTVRCLSDPDQSAVGSRQDTGRRSPLMANTVGTQTTGRAPDSRRRNEPPVPSRRRRPGRIRACDPRLTTMTRMRPGSVEARPPVAAISAGSVPSTDRIPIGSILGPGDPGRQGWANITVRAGSGGTRPESRCEVKMVIRVVRGARRRDRPRRRLDVPRR